MTVILTELLCIEPGDVCTALGAIVAYEPVWAIGTGRTATPDDATAVAVTMAGCISETFSIKSTVLLTPAEMDEAVKKRPSFRPPSRMRMPLCSSIVRSVGRFSASGRERRLVPFCVSIPLLVYILGSVEILTMLFRDWRHMSRPNRLQR